MSGSSSLGALAARLDSFAGGGHPALHEAQERINRLLAEESAKDAALMPVAAAGDAGLGGEAALWGSMERPPQPGPAAILFRCQPEIQRILYEALGKALGGG